MDIPHFNLWCADFYWYLLSISFLNSYSPSAVYMHQRMGSTLVQIMACCLLGTKPLSKWMLVIVNWTLGNKLQWKFNQNFNFFIHENAFENVICKMEAYFSRGRGVNISDCWNWPPKEGTKSIRVPITQFGRHLTLTCQISKQWEHFITQCRWFSLSEIVW